MYAYYKLGEYIFHGEDNAHIRELHIDIDSTQSTKSIQDGFTQYGKRTQKENIRSRGRMKAPITTLAKPSRNLEMMKAKAQKTNCQN
jgi:hypothetical protein